MSALGAIDTDVAVSDGQPEVSYTDNNSWVVANTEKNRLGGVMHDLLTPRILHVCSQLLHVSRVRLVRPQSIRL